MKRRTVIAAAAGLLTASFLACMLLPSADSGDSVYLSDMEADRNAECLLYCKDCTEYGKQIKVGGKVYEKGVLTHPGYNGPSEMTYRIGGMGFETFYAVGGKDASAGTQVGGDSGIRGTRVRLQVYVDGVLRADSGDLAYPDTYTFIVDVRDAQELKLVTSDGGDGIYCDATGWADARLLRSGAEVPTEAPTEAPTEPTKQDPALRDVTTAYLSDMVIRRWDCHLNEVFRDRNLLNEDLYIDMDYYDKGLSIHALPDRPGFAEIEIDGLGFTTFGAYIGVCYCEASDCSMGSIICRVYCDDVLKYESPVIRAKENGVYTQPLLVQVDVTGAKMLRLEVDPTSDGYAGDMACWGNACVTRLTDVTAAWETGSPTAAPTELPTEPPTEPASAPETVPDTTSAAQTQTGNGSIVETDAQTVPDTKPAPGGCRGLIAGLSVLILTAAGAVLMRRRKKG